MTTTEIAHRLVELCRQGKFKPAQQELFADDAVSIEPHATPGFDKETRGLNAIIEKGDRFQAMLDQVHGISVSDPLTAGNAFAVVLTMDVTMKGRPRETLKELCVYQVKNGKIVSETFVM